MDKKPNGKSEIAKIAITKLDAARRQLETAVILWFHDGDPVSIHTLAAACYQIVYDIKQKRGGSSMMLDLECVRDEYRNKFRREFAKHENFFKHADRDSLETLHFPPQITPCFMLDAARKYQEMTHEQRPLFQLLITYLLLTQPELFGDDVVDKFRSAVPMDKFPTLSRREFFQHFLASFTRIESV